VVLIIALFQANKNNQNLKETRISEELKKLLFSKLMRETIDISSKSEMKLMLLVLAHQSFFW
jgi:S-adenosylmethionine:diacylglycerol 3-amino-3-carboxypropyl transferase